MSQKIFNPERGQFFWYVKEVIEYGFPNLKVKNAKFDPRVHGELLKKKNCFLTEEEALKYLSE